MKIAALHKILKDAGIPHTYASRHNGHRWERTIRMEHYLIVTSDWVSNDLLASLRAFLNLTRGSSPI